MFALHPLRILVVEDDDDTRANLRDILELDGHMVETAGSIAQTLAAPCLDRCDAILLDHRMADGTSLELLPELKRRAPAAAVMVVTAYAELSGAIAALRHGAADYILKPINVDALKASLARVAERRQLEQARHRSEAAFRTLVEAAPCVIAILNFDFQVLYFSPYAERLTGKPAAEVVSCNFLHTFLPETWRLPTQQTLRNVMQGTPTHGFENSIQAAGGGQYSLIWNAQRLEDYDGRPAILLVGQDITQLKCIQEQALQSARLAAIGQMVAGLAHESGTALARSRACLEMLGSLLAGNEEAAGLIDGVRRAQDHLQQLYDDVRSYASPLRMERTAWKLSSIWQQAWENLALQRKDRDASIEFAIDAAHLRLDVDQFRMEQVFRNIFENSLAACADPVRISIWCRDAACQGRDAVAIHVRDNGPGLTEEQAQRIFEPFYTTKPKGTGLGMAISRRIVEAHGGMIEVHRQANAGAEIVITLPR